MNTRLNVRSLSLPVSACVLVCAVSAHAQLITDSSLVLHYDASDLNGDGFRDPAPFGLVRVDQWNDKSASAAHALRSGTNENVFLYPSTLNGQPTVHFGNTHNGGTTGIDRLESALMSAEQITGANRDQISVFMVTRRHANVVHFQWETAGTNRIGFEGSSRWDFVDTNATATGGQLVANFTQRGEPFIFGAIRTPASAAVSPRTQFQYFNGALDYNTRQTSLTLAAGTSAKWGIGTQSVASGGGNPSHVDFGDIVVYKRALSDAERLQVEAYFRKKYFLDSASRTNGVYVNRGATEMRANLGAFWGTTSAASVTNSTGTLVGFNANETADKAFDNFDQTKYLMPGASTTSAAPTAASPYYIYARTAANAALTVSSYAIISANDVPARDPKDWALQGSNDGTTWTTIDARTAQSFAARFQKNTYTVASPAPFSQYRLRVDANNGDTSTTASLQFAELLFNANPVLTSSTTPTNAQERVNQAFDGRTDTKFLTTATNPSGWVQAQLPSPQIIRAYAVASANDVPGRDPRNWTMEGSNDGSSWTVLDTQTGVAWQSRYQMKEFNIPNSTAYTYYRLNVSKNWGETQMQLSEFQLFNYSATTDSDADGAPDAREFQEFGNLSTLIAGDDDSDGLSNGWEFTHFGAIASSADGTGDADSDGLTDLQEFSAGTNPKMPDTDGDGRTDSQEAVAGTNPSNRDSDGDGLSDGEEFAAATNPLNADSDGDGQDDALEVALGFNPNSTASNPLLFNSIAINFADNDVDLVGARELAGPFGYQARNWNNVAGRSSAAPYSSNLTSVVSNNGTTYPMTVDWTSPGTLRFNNSTYANYNTPAKRLLNGYLDDSTTDGQQYVTLTNIPFARYHVIVFTEGDNTANGVTGSYRILDSTGTSTIAAKRYLANTGGLDTTIQLTDGTTATSGFPVGNALIFRDLSASAIRVQGLRESTPVATRSPIGGIMIVPFDPTTDSDGDGLADEREIVFYQSLNQNGTSDTDGDGLTFAQEITIGSNPALVDTDGDGISDGVEVTNGTSPLLADTDGDGISDLAEIQIGTNGNSPDSDGDTFADGLEIAMGSNPASGASTPPSDLLFYEGFSSILYGAGRFDTQTGSLLYSPRTFTTTAATSAASIFESSLSYGNLSTTGGLLRTPPGPSGTSSQSFGTLDISASSRFAPLVNGGFVGGGTASGTVYFSFLAKSNRLSRDWLGNIISGTYTEPAPSSRAISPSFFGFQFYRGATEVIGIGESTNSTNYSAFFPGAGTGEADFGTVRLNNQTRLFVGKITFNASANDNIQLWLDPNLALAEGAQTGPTIIRNGNGDCSFNTIAWRSGSSSNDGSVDFDEIRFGTTWASVLPTVVDPSTSGVVINEFAASNPGTIRDEDGSSSDWIELYNGSALPVTLDGMYLTDSATLPTKWQFPDTTPDRVIPPGGYLIVWASNKDAAKRPFYTSSSQLHTNFQLGTNTGVTPDVLRLIAADGTTEVSGFGGAYPPQSSVATYGRSGASAGFMQPTPGTANGAIFPTAPSILTIAPGSSVRTAPTLVTITGQLPGQQVRYTLDGSTPSISNGFTYTGPFTVSTTAQVRARVSQPGMSGPIASSVLMFYTATAQNNPVNTYHLPILVIDTHGRTIPVDGSADSNEYPVDCSYVLYDAPPTGVSLQATTPEFLSRGRVSARGKSTSGEVKRPFNVEFWDNDRDADNSRSVLGIGSNSDWVLNNIYGFDRGGLRNSTMFTLGRQMDHLSMEYRFVEVYLNQDGGDIANADYYGMFLMVQKPNRANDRVDVERLEPDQNTGPDVTGGYILQLNKSYNVPATDFHNGIARGVGVASAALGSFNFGLTSAGTGNNTSDFLLEYPEEDRVTTQQADYIVNYLNEMEDCLAPAATNYTNPVTGLKFTDYVDLPSWIDHHMLDTFSNNVDGLRLSWRLFKPRNGKLFSGPGWDYDRSMNSVDARDDSPTQWHATTGGYGTQFFIYSYWSRIFANADYMQAWIDRWTNLRQPGGVFSDSNMQAVVDANAALVSPPTLVAANAAIRNQTRWSAAAYTSGSLNAERDLIKSWMVAKGAFIDGQILRFPALNIAGGPITTSTSLTLASSDFVGVAKIYYTIDGSDPRLPGGVLNPAATEYTGAFTLPAGHRLVRARLFKSDAPAFNSTLTTTKMSTWSGLNEAYFFTDAVPATTGNLVVSELMYHPADPTPTEIAAGYLDSDRFEYIELLNIGAAPIDLFECRFASGIDYHFRNGSITQLAPGQRMLIVKDTAAFAFRYGAGPAASVAGVFEGNDNFNNAGETVTIVDRTGATILSFAYGTTAPWPPQADGLGRSLVLMLPEGNPNAALAASWRASVITGGEPGGVDSRLFTGTGTEDADADGIPALVEHVMGASDTNPNSYTPPIAGFITIGPDTFQTLSVIHDLRADGVAVSAERSGDLLAWDATPAGIVLVSATPDGAGRETLVFRSVVPFVPSGAEYLRIRATKP